ncbi:MAG TPA: hypothetical protein VK139_02155 [Microbacteriaceae bacterium]|nr:hypothetical protein [Microbacteriaceae bacterium]
MIDWFTTVLVSIALASAVLCIVAGLAGRVPNDWTLGSIALLTALLLGQVGISLVAPAVGNSPTGSLLEFWVYLISAVCLPVAAGFWALLERSRWSTVILGVAALSIAIMAYRMWQIWTVQLA